MTKTATAAAVVVLLLCLLLMHTYRQHQHYSRKQASSNAPPQKRLRHQSDNVVAPTASDHDGNKHIEHSYSSTSSSWSASTQRIRFPIVEDDLVRATPLTHTKPFKKDNFRPCLDLVRCDRPCNPSPKLPTCVPKQELLWTEAIAESAYTHFVDSAVEFQRVFTRNKLEHIKSALTRGAGRGHMDLGGEGLHSAEARKMKGCHCPAPQCMMWTEEDASAAARLRVNESGSVVFLGPRTEDLVEGSRTTQDELIASFGRCVENPYFVRENHRSGDDEDLVCYNTPAAADDAALWKKRPTNRRQRNNVERTNVVTQGNQPLNNSMKNNISARSTALLGADDTTDTIMVHKFQQQTSWMFRQWFPWAVKCIPTTNENSETTNKDPPPPPRQYAAFHSKVTGLYTIYNGCLNSYGRISGYRPSRVDPIEGTLDWGTSEDTKYFGQVTTLRKAPQCTVMSDDDAEDDDALRRRYAQLSREDKERLNVSSLEEYLARYDDSPPEVVLIPLVQFTSNHMHILHRAASAMVASKYFAWIRRRKKKQRDDDARQQQGNPKMMNNATENVLDPSHDDLAAFPDEDAYLKEILFVFVCMDTTVQHSANTYSFYYPLMTHKWASIFAFKPSKNVLRSIHSRRHRKLFTNLGWDDDEGTFVEQKKRRQQAPARLCFRKMVVMHQCPQDCDWWAHDPMNRSYSAAATRAEERFQSMTIGRRHYKRDGAALQIVRNRVQRCLNLPERRHANIAHPRFIYAVRTASRRHTLLALKVPKLAQRLFAAPYNVRSFEVLEHTQLKPADVFRIHWFGDMLMGQYGGGLAYEFLLPPGAVLNQISHVFKMCGRGGWGNETLLCDYCAEAELLQIIPLQTLIPDVTIENGNPHSVSFRITPNVYSNMLHLMFCALRLVPSPSEYSKLYLEDVAERSEAAYRTRNRTLDLSSTSTLMAQVRQACPYDALHWDYGTAMDGDL